MILSLLLTWLWMAFTYLWFPTLHSYLISIFWNLYILSILYFFLELWYIFHLYYMQNWTLNCTFSLEHISLLPYRSKWQCCLLVSQARNPSLLFCLFISLAYPSSVDSPSIFCNPVHSILSSPQSHPCPSCQSLFPALLYYFPHSSDKVIFLMNMYSKFSGGLPVQVKYNLVHTKICT